MIDFHCHQDLYPDPAAVAAEAQERAVKVLSVTTTPSAFRGTSALADDRPTIRTAIGLHPELAAHRTHELPMFDSLLATTEYVGEVGLDGSARFAETKDAQLDVFNHILRSCADAGGRILSIHSRGAAQPTIDALKGNPEAGTPVLHWFTGTPRQLESAVDLGCWFSVGTPMLRTPKGRDLVSRMPPDRILTETDGPFTQANRAVAHPWHVHSALALLAEHWGISTAATEARINDNLRRLINRTQARNRPIL